MSWYCDIRKIEKVRAKEIFAKRQNKIPLTREDSDILFDEGCVHKNYVDGIGLKLYDVPTYFMGRNECMCIVERDKLGKFLYDCREILSMEFISSKGAINKYYETFDCVNKNLDDLETFRDTFEDLRRLYYTLFDEYTYWDDEYVLVFVI